MSSTPYNDNLICYRTLSFATILVTWLTNVTACQTCIGNALFTTTPQILSLQTPKYMDYGLFISNYGDAITSRNDMMLQKFGYQKSQISRLPLRRQPLRMFNNDNKSYNGTSSSNNNSNETVESEMNRTVSIPLLFDIGEVQSKNKSISNNDDNQDENAMSAAMIGSIGFYKKVISPVLPPACRFIPTCSTYGVQAIQQYGPMKGFILITWRILRCSPIGGKGYDPPKWPPVAYTYSSY
jgi:uncharacterized protein